MVNLSGGEQHGYVLLKDIAGATQFLLHADGKDYGPWEFARHSRPGRDELFRDRLAVAHLRRGDRPTDHAAERHQPGRRTRCTAVRRTQLHIHVPDCVRSDVRNALRAAEPTIRGAWAPLGVPLEGHRVFGDESGGRAVAGQSPSSCLRTACRARGTRWGTKRSSSSVPRSPTATGPGFILLDDRANAAATGTLGAARSFRITPARCDAAAAVAAGLSGQDVACGRACSHLDAGPYAHRAQTLVVIG